MNRLFKRRKFIKFRRFADLSIGSGLELIEKKSDHEVFMADKNNRKLFSKGFVEYRN
jgi:hypothetical protein